MSENKIGFVGIGNMGGPMAANLIRAGRKVVVFDINPDQARKFADENGAEAAATLAELGAAVDVVITMLPTGHDVRHMMLEQEDGGLVKSLKAGSLLIDMSSSDPIGTRELGKALEEYNIQVVDAPVSGGVPGAVEGTLAIMIGGDDKAAVERAKPILENMGKRLFETGPLGSGHAMKALNNIVAGAGFAAISEALITGQKFGLDPAVMIDILNSSTGRSFNSEYTFGSHVLNSSFASGFALALCCKDVKIAADLARAQGLEAPVLQMVSERWQLAGQGLGAGKDFTEAYAFWDSLIKPEQDK